MQLIIKPTGRCNFNCTFCSAHGMDIQHPTDGHVPQQIKDLIKKLKPTGVIVTGGEPLMLPPSYYYELHDLVPGYVSITSNLKSFVIDTITWTPLFNEDWFNVVTSFQYGPGRMWDKDNVYNESMFKYTCKMFKECTGHAIHSFIAVLTNENEQYALDHVKLAKELGCKVRLNGAIAVGRQQDTYPRYKMMKHYFDIIDAGLEEYEINCIERSYDMCPRSITAVCQNSVNCCYVDTSGKLHVGICDEQLSIGNEIPEDEIGKQVHRSHDVINDKCLQCELCRFCNGCTTNRMLAKQDPNYCDEMLKIEDKIKSYGWII